jgi:phosphatidylinositol transfer protein SFH5
MERSDTAPASDLPSASAKAEEEPISTVPIDAVDNPAEATTTTKVDPVDEAPLETTPPSSGPQWPELAETHPLFQLHSALPALLTTADYNEVYGITLKPKEQGCAGDFHTLLILQKFLRANANNVEQAKEQLAKTLAWRKTFDPLKAMSETFSKEKFDGLGYVTTIDSKEHEGRKNVVTWNIYGAVKDNEKTFVPVDEYVPSHIQPLLDGDPF